MEKKYRCKRCGYVWKSKEAKYCLRCYSRDIRRLHFLRDKTSDAGRGFFKRAKSSESSFSKKFSGARDYLIDFWAAIKGLIFIIIVFVILIIFAIIYIYWM